MMDEMNEDYFIHHGVRWRSLCRLKACTSYLAKEAPGQHGGPCSLLVRSRRLKAGGFFELNMGSEEKLRLAPSKLSRGCVLPRRGLEIRTLPHMI